MRALGVNHIKKLVVPRVLVTMLAMPMLTIIADALGIFGGMVISQYEFNVEYHQYYNTITQYVKLADMIDGLGKTVVFGFLIGVIGLLEDPTVYEDLSALLRGANRSTLLRGLIRSTREEGLREKR